MREINKEREILDAAESFPESHLPVYKAQLWNDILLTSDSDIDSKQLKKLITGKDIRGWMIIILVFGVCRINRS